MPGVLLIMDLFTETEKRTTTIEETIRVVYHLESMHLNVFIGGISYYAQITKIGERVELRWNGDFWQVMVHDYGHMLEVLGSDGTLFNKEIELT